MREKKGHNMQKSSPAITEQGARRHVAQPPGASNLQYSIFNQRAKQAKPNLCSIKDFIFLQSYCSWSC